MAKITSFYIKDNDQTTDESLVEAARQVQRQKRKEFDKAMMEREVFFKTTAKMQPQQKIILIWLWQKTQTLETFLYKIDHDANFQSELKISELNIWEWRSISANLESLSEKDRVAFENAMILREARLYRLSGIRWSISAFTTDEPTSSQRASLSRSLSRLVDRNLVIKNKDRGTVKLTKLGRDISEKLTL